MNLRIDAKQRLIFDHMPGFWGCKDVDSVFMYANEEYGKLVGVKHHLDVVDRTDFDMPCGTSAFAESFRSQDREVISSLKPLRILDIHTFAGGRWRAYLVTKAPFFDEQQEVIGTIFHGIDISSSNTVELGSLLGRIYTGMGAPSDLGHGSYLIDNGSKDPTKLTKRESEVLFFLIRGHAAKDIARIFEMSVRTVEDHLVALRHKFACPNKAGLIDKAIYLGYLNYIPESLFTKQLSVVLRD